MIHYRRTHPMAPGRQADAVAFVKKVAEFHKQVTGIGMRVTVVTTGTLGRLCLSADYESIGAMEATDAKFSESPEFKAMAKLYDQELRDGNSPWVPGAEYEEIWPDA